MIPIFSLPGRFLSRCASALPVIAIRREDKSRWERRAPLSPDNVADLVKAGFRVVVQPSGVRVFSDEQYRQSGAEITEDLNVADIVLGVKEVKPYNLIDDKAFIFFSHVIKAQPYNMKMLDELLKKKIMHIDYESIKDEKGDRLVKFGKFAGNAGTIDFMYGLGDRLLALGYNTPFLELGLSKSYPTLESAKTAIRAVGNKIHRYGIPKKFGPMTFCITGEGAVSSGSKEILDCLPQEVVDPHSLKDIVQQHSGRLTNKIYTCIAGPQHSTVHIHGKPFDYNEFLKQPQNFRPIFAEKIMPYVSCIINCTYWDEKYPRLVTNAQMDALHKKGNHRLIGVADISADLEGSLQFMNKITNIDEPFYVFDLNTKQNHRELTAAIDPKTGKNNGVLFMTIDCLPTELAQEATAHFGEMLVPYLKETRERDFKKPLDEIDMPAPLKRAIITQNGSLTPRFQYIQDLRKKTESGKKRILVLGAGNVAGPVVEYLSRFPHIEVTVADMVESAARGLASKYPRATGVHLDISDKAKLEELAASHDVLVSLLPYIFHGDVAKMALKHKKNMVTASYVQPAIAAMEADVKRAGITILNELGLDPGLDHFTALRIIHACQKKGGRVESFSSYCGGLPAPEASGNPLGYKFSWSPRGVLLASNNSAKFLRNGKIVNYPNIFDARETIRTFPGFNLEGYPNRDSTTYIEPYGIQNVQNMFRGTLRYGGFIDIINSMRLLGIISPQPNPLIAPGAAPITWADFIKKLGKTNNVEQAILKAAGLAKKPDAEKAKHIINAYKWLGITGNAPVPQKGAPIDAMVSVMEPKMQYAPGERDLCILHHEFGLRDASNKKSTVTSTLIEYGDPKGYTSMAKTVGMPVGVGARMLADGIITRRGVLRPMTPDVYEPIMQELEKNGISMIEKESH